MLAIFGKQKGELSGPLTPTKRKTDLCITPDEEEYVASYLDNLYSSLPRRQRGYVEEHIFGGGANGIAYTQAENHQLFCHGDVTLYFTGRLEDLPDDMSEAEFVCRRYDEAWTAAEAESAAPDVCRALRSVTALGGAWALVLCDRLQRRLVVARDPSGAEPLFLARGEGLVLASDAALLQACAGNVESEGYETDPAPLFVEAFPPGGVFISSPGETSGTLHFYMEDSEPLDFSKAALADQAEAPAVVGPLCRVQSRGSLTPGGLPRAPSSQHHIVAG